MLQVALTMVMLDLLHACAKFHEHTYTVLCAHNVTSGKNHFHEMNGDVGMAGWK